MYELSSCSFRTLLTSVDVDGLMDTEISHGEDSRDGSSVGVQEFILR